MISLFFLIVFVPFAILAMETVAAIMTGAAVLLVIWVFYFVRTRVKSNPDNRKRKAVMRRTMIF
ncbi:MAG: hypothetical protein ACLFPE_04430 [Bacteroidales bacterium]